MTDAAGATLPVHGSRQVQRQDPRHGRVDGVRVGEADMPVYASQFGARPFAGRFNRDAVSDIGLAGGIGWNTVPTALRR